MTTTSSLGTVLDGDKLLDAARSLSALPASAVRLAGLAAENDADMLDIVETIELDQNLTAAVLRQANSAAAGHHTRIGTVRDAVVRLGLNSVLAVALSGPLSKQMHRAIPQYDLTAGELWRHSVLSSIAVELLRSRCPVPIPADAPTAALMHDIGKLVLCRHMTDDMVEAIREIRAQDDCELFEAEMRVLDVHHGLVGALIAAHWNLPESIVMAVAHHHTPSLAPLPITYAVALGNVVADYLDGPGREILEGGSNDIVDDFGLTGPALEGLIDILVNLHIGTRNCYDLVYATATRYQNVRRRYNIDDE